MDRRTLQAAGYDVTEQAHARLRRYVARLLTENEIVNLTGPRDADTLWRLHICDSLALREVLAPGTTALIDIGSGGGLPGIPLACACPDLAVTLLDATAKKVAALERIIAALELPNCRAQCARAETAAHDASHRAQYDAATARAVAPLATLIEYAAGFVHAGGHCWFFKSRAGLADEHAAAASAAERCVLRPGSEHVYTLPGQDAPRVLISYEKTGALDAALPRAPGRARKRPL